MMTAADVLERAADLIERDGHAKGKLHDWRSGGYCAQGALLYVYRGVADWPQDMPRFDSIAAVQFMRKNDPIFMGAAKALHEMIGGQIIDWNNATGRTAAEVTSTMRACAALLRARERMEPVAQPAPEMAHA